jgi:hypothetical protein
MIRRRNHPGKKGGEEGVTYLKVHTKVDIKIRAADEEAHHLLTNDVRCKASRTNRNHLFTKTTYVNVLSRWKENEEEGVCEQGTCFTISNRTSCLSGIRTRTKDAGGFANSGGIFLPATKQQKRRARGEARWHHDNSLT